MQDTQETQIERSNEARSEMVKTLNEEIQEMEKAHLAKDMEQTAEIMTLRAERDDLHRDIAGLKDALELVTD